MRFVGADEIRNLLSFPMLIAALEAAHHRPKIEVQDGFLGSEEAQYFVRHAVDRGRYMASKLITSFPGNLDGGRLPAVQAICVLFDGTNADPLLSSTAQRSRTGERQRIPRSVRKSSHRSSPQSCWLSAREKCRLGWFARTVQSDHRFGACSFGTAPKSERCK